MPARKYMDIKHPLLFTTQIAWRKWLFINHAEMNDAWVYIFKKPFWRKGITYEQALEEALCYGWIDGRMKSVDAEKFILRFSPRKPESTWSKMNQETAARLIAAGRMKSAGMAAINAAKKNGVWDKAFTNLKPEALPADLEILLSQDKTASTNFMNFANTYRNMYIHWINRAKTLATRRQRLAEVVKRAKANKKLLTE